MHPNQLFWGLVRDLAGELTAFWWKEARSQPQRKNLIPRSWPFGSRASTFRALIDTEPLLMRTTLTVALNKYIGLRTKEPQRTLAA